jgi:hypothetical protein
MFGALILVATAVGLAAVFQFGVSGEIITGFNAENPSMIDQTVMQGLADNQNEWIALQNELQCCGWGENNGTLATGEYCSQVNATAADPCRDELLQVVENASFSVVLVASITLVILLCIVMSVCCLTCCAKKQDVLDPADYQRMVTGNGGNYVGARV